jgi:hypothetical protein
MHRVKTQSWLVAAIAGLFTLLALSAWSPTLRGQAPAAAGVTAFEGARLIAGDGRAPIENATFVVNGTRFVQVGRPGEVRVPAGAARVSLAGKTVMPAIIDTHTHLSQTREALTDDLRRRAYYGVGAAMSRAPSNTVTPAAAGPCPRIFGDHAETADSARTPAIAATCRDCVFTRCLEASTAELEDRIVHRRGINVPVYRHQTSSKAACPERRKHLNRV